MSSASQSSDHSSSKNKEKLDKEWIQLLAEAKKIGIKPEEVRRYIALQKKNN
ncbi:MAG: DNA-binding anti-repressor SinI [Bacillaceae bacterium]|nr:DNA-binding anti-repressor SinI [Bacillaceae bacterium]